nr:beta-galactosidase-1-like protein 3 [Leptinotarsa decemlineata]
MCVLPFFIVLVFPFKICGGLPTNYEYYTLNEITNGLSSVGSQFTLNNRNITVYSGTMHYFRVHRAYWRDRLRKIRAAGLNTVETYVPWNLHEPHSGVYDFGGGGSHMEDFLYLEEFLQLAQEQDLFVILRPGPYISAEYNFGGFPSWLLGKTPMGFRTDESNYLKYVSRYFNKLLPNVRKYQFSKGGPIIAFQIENEYGYTGYGNFAPSKIYLRALRQLYLDNDIVELLVTSDNAIARGDSGTLPGVLFQTVNFGDSPENYLGRLNELQPNKPLMVMEFWIGWFDHWTDNHQTRSTSDMRDVYERILKYPASVNIYMFHGGCNFAFGNGAHLNNDLLDNSAFLPTTTSYDYDAPLNEAGDYTEKYYAVKELLEKYNVVKTFIPDTPELIPRISYSSVVIDKQIKLFEIINNFPPYLLKSKQVIAMENLKINNGSGQSYGYIVYRKENIDLEAGSILKIVGHVCDTVMVLVNGELVSPFLENSSDLNNFGYWRMKDSTLKLNEDKLFNATVDIIVEEWGRMHGGNILQYNQTFKGLWQEQVYINDVEIADWTIIPLEFKKQWINSLEVQDKQSSYDGPCMYQATLLIHDEPKDSYIDMRRWSKGLVIVNGFPLGKYFKLGPQQALYLPAPLLRRGSNSIIVFEHFKASNEISFVTDQIWSNQ